MSVLNRGSAVDQSQERGGQDHVRTFDPWANETLIDILNELKKMNQYLHLITDEEIDDDIERF